MKPLPDFVIKAWDEREPIAVLTTVAPDGTPNAIYVGSVGRFDDSTFFVANNYFHKTKENILAGSKASLLFLTKEGKAFQVKGSIELQDSGPIFDEMKRINPEKYPGHSAAVLRVETGFSGADQLL
jgi:predicted pyridoxine 5'-phosphate oxidase superfamily flavin-nucleotide-binding protein